MTFYHISDYLLKINNHCIDLVCFGEIYSARNYLQFVISHIYGTMCNCLKFYQDKTKELIFPLLQPFFDRVVLGFWSKFWYI